jgi:transmembrane sensor
MKHDIPWLLLEKVFSQKATTKEGFEAEQWRNATPENEMIYAQLLNYFREKGSLPVHFTPDVKKAYTAVAEQTGSVKSSKIRYLQVSTWVKVAAVLVFALIGWWVAYEQEAFRAITYASVTTSDSVQTTVVLPDGTRVWLNYGSELQYSRRFKANRTLQLNGEAYFEVAHDSLHPFVVHANNASVRVLGTKFNVEAYANTAIDDVTVTEGRVSYGAGQETVKLIAGDKGLFSKETGAVQKTINDDANFLSWKTKAFIFDNTQLTDALSDLAKVYRFTFKFSAPSLSNLTLTAQFTNRPLDEILQTISLTLSVKIIKQSGNYIIYAN